MIKRLIKATYIYSIYSGYKRSRERKKNERRYLKEIKTRIKSNTLLKDFDEEELKKWNKRISVVLASADNQKIKCVKKAGTLNRGLLVMHNGLVIEPLSYYGYPLLKMLVKNRGIHEPQEEYVFQEVLKEMPDGATMIELGAYWSFYSMWFNKQVKDANNYMIEPEDIKSGINNFKLNNLKGKFFQYYIADKSYVNQDGSKVISVDSFIKDNKIGFIDILHSDIQGYELLMLKGAENLFKKKRVGYIFISTHSDELHVNCLNHLESLGFIQVCSADLQQTFSVDGLLVYKNPEYRGIKKIEISLRGKN